MKKHPIPCLVVILIAGCAPAYNEGISPLPTGIKRVYLTVKDHSNLNTSVGKVKIIEFPCEFLSTSPRGDGTQTIQLRLKPSYGGHGDAAWFGDSNGATHEVIARTASGGDVFSISGRLLTPRNLSLIPLTSLTGDVSVTASGPDVGTIISFNVTEPQVVDTKRAGKNRYVGTYRTSPGGSTFSLPFYYPRDLEGTNIIDDHGTAVGNGDLTARGDAGSWFHLTASGWNLQQGGAGPDTPDLSFLETTSNRGEFD